MRCDEAAGGVCWARKRSAQQRTSRLANSAQHVRQVSAAPSGAPSSHLCQVSMSDVCEAGVRQIIMAPLKDSDARKRKKWRDKSAGAKEQKMARRQKDADAGNGV